MPPSWCCRYGRYAAHGGWQGHRRRRGRLAATLILREGNAPLDVGPQPDYVGEDLDAIAGQLTKRYPAGTGATGHGRDLSWSQPY